MDIKVQITLIICITSLIAYIALLFFKSKCSEILCGKYKCKRNTAIEDKTADTLKLPI